MSTIKADIIRVIANTILKQSQLLSLVDELQGVDPDLADPLSALCYEMSIISPYGGEEPVCSAALDLVLQGLNALDDTDKQTTVPNSSIKIRKLLDPLKLLLERQLAHLAKQREALNLILEQLRSQPRMTVDEFIRLDHAHLCINSYSLAGPFKGKTLLHVCSMMGRADLIACLLDLGADPNLLDAYGNFPINYLTAAIPGELAKQLLPNPTQIPVSSKYGEKLLAVLDASITQNNLALFQIWMTALTSYLAAMKNIYINFSTHSSRIGTLGRICLNPNNFDFLVIYHQALLLSFNSDAYFWAEFSDEANCIWVTQHPTDKHPLNIFEEDEVFRHTDSRADIWLRPLELLIMTRNQEALRYLVDRPDSQRQFSKSMSYYDDDEARLSLAFHFVATVKPGGRLSQRDCQFLCFLIHDPATEVFVPKNLLELARNQKYENLFLLSPQNTRIIPIQQICLQYVCTHTRWNEGSSCQAVAQFFERARLAPINDDLQAELAAIPDETLRQQLSSAIQEIQLQSRAHQSELLRLHFLNQKNEAPAVINATRRYSR